MLDALEPVAGGAMRSILCRFAHCVPLEADAEGTTLQLQRLSQLIIRGTRNSSRYLLNSGKAIRSVVSSCTSVIVTTTIG
jgi:hypothetical protein